MEDSILNSVKKALGIQSDYTHFDPELIMFINGAFTNLHQLGVGSEKPFIVTDEKDIWSDFIQDYEQIELVKSYVYLKTRMIFDPPVGSTADSFNEMIKEAEWRLNVGMETPCLNLELKEG